MIFGFGSSIKHNAFSNPPCSQLITKSKLDQDMRLEMVRTFKNPLRAPSVHKSICVESSPSKLGAIMVNLASVNLSAIWAKSLAEMPLPMARMQMFFKGLEFLSGAILPSGLVGKLGVLSLRPIRF